ncbi:hypothetical protein ACA910_001663 [Epithemia clementina (nom. ined.)]
MISTAVSTQMMLFAKPWRMRSCQGVIALVLAGHVAVGVYLATAAFGQISRQQQASSSHGLFGKRNKDDRDTFLRTLLHTPRLGNNNNDKMPQQLSVQLICPPQEDAKYDQRHSSKSYTAPVDVPSIFNCQHPTSGGQCRYFFPANFFDPKCGLGRDYAYMVTETEDRLRKRRLWKEGPRVGFNVYSTHFKLLKDGRRILVQNQQPQPSPSRRRRLQEQISSSSEHETVYFERLSFVHVHKAGGTSIKDTQTSLAEAGFGNLIRMPWFYPRLTLEIDQPKYVNAFDTLQHAGRYTTAWFSNVTLETKQDGDDDDDTNERPQPVMIFTLVRDPVARFISSIGQVMGGEGSNGQLAKRFRAACLKSSAQETIACCLNYVKSQSLTGFELHFAPQTLDIAFTTLWQDVPVAVFSMEQSLTAVLQSFSEREVVHTPNQTPRRKVESVTQTQRRDSKLKTDDSAANSKRSKAQNTTTEVVPIITRRNGAIPGYRPDPSLTSMSVQDYNSTLLRQVCELYVVDVLMLLSLGFSTRCDQLFMIS